MSQGKLFKLTLFKCGHSLIYMQILISYVRKCVYLISGSLWSLISLRVTSQACLKRPSVPMGPIAWTIFWVSRNGTTSGTSNVSPLWTGK